MSELTSIEWTDHTFNPWIGCTKVSPGCANCYAEAQDKFRRWTPEGWGPGKPRRLASDAMWKQPLKWNREAAEEVEDAMHDFGEDKYIAPPRPKVFCASLADWLDDDGVPTEWLTRLLLLIFETPNLDWQLLTKRPQNWRRRIDEVRWAMKDPGLVFEGWLNQWVNGDAPANVWIGTTVEDQRRADERIPALLKIPARVRFLSCEPLLGEIDFNEVPMDDRCYGVLGNHPEYPPGIDWVICGGESGPKARPMHPDWARSLRDQCAAAGVAFFFKQWGEHAPYWHLGGEPVIAQSFDPDFRRKVREGEVIGGSTEEAMVRVGKKRAGRLLDGVEHSAFPNSTSTAIA